MFSNTVFTHYQTPAYPASLTEGPLDLLPSFSPESSQPWAICAGPNGPSLSSTNLASPELQKRTVGIICVISHSLDSQAGHDITQAKNDVSAYHGIGGLHSLADSRQRRQSGREGL